MVEVDNDNHLVILNTFYATNKWAVGYTSNWDELPSMHHSLFIELDGCNRPNFMLTDITKFIRDITQTCTMGILIKSSPGNYHMVFPHPFNIETILKVYGYVMLYHLTKSNEQAFRNWLSFNITRGYYTLRLSGKKNNTPRVTTVRVYKGKTPGLINPYHYGVLKAMDEDKLLYTDKRINLNDLFHMSDLATPKCMTPYALDKFMVDTND